MVTGLEQGLKAGKKGLDEIRYTAIALGRLLKIGDDQYGAHPDGVDWPVLRHEVWIIHRSQACGHIACGHHRIERHSQQVQPVISFDVTKKGSGLPCYEGESWYLAIAQLFERHLGRVVSQSDRAL